MIPLGIVRPEDWEFPVLVHVLGAMLLVGSLVVVVTALVVPWIRGGADRPATTRFAFWTLVFAIVPSYVVMRVGAQWAASVEDQPDDVTWLTVGYIVSDVGVPLTLVAIMLAGLGLRASRRDPQRGVALERAAAVLSVVLLAAYVVAVWAMTVKPT